MGFLSGVKDLAPAGLGAGAGFLVGGVPGAVVGAGIGSSLSSSILAGRAADSAADAQKDLIALQREDLARQMQIRDESIAEGRKAFDAYRDYTGPQREIGRNALEILAFESGTGPRPEGYTGLPFSVAAEAAVDATERSAAARGNVFSSDTLEQIGRVGVENRNTELNRLASLASYDRSPEGEALGFLSGLPGANNTQITQTVGDLGRGLVGIGQQQANEYVDRANIQSGLVNQLALLGGLFGGGGGGVGGGGNTSSSGFGGGYTGGIGPYDLRNFGGF